MDTIQKQNKKETTKPEMVSVCKLVNNECQLK